MKLTIPFNGDITTSPEKVFTRETYGEDGYYLVSYGTINLLAVINDQTVTTLPISQAVVKNNSPFLLNIEDRLYNLLEATTTRLELLRELEDAKRTYVVQNEESLLPKWFVLYVGSLISGKKGNNEN